MAESWTSGYVTEVGYQWSYFSELNPMRAKIALPCNGIACPEIHHACELGFGQGVSLNMHAAGSDMEWHGNDFNPSHAYVARELAGHSGALAHVTDQSFEEFRRREDLPQFDYIGVHGVWSWVSDENRREIVDFIKAKLKVGGVLYISYNVQPGWAGFIPLRNLMMEYLDRISPRGKGMEARIDETLEFAEKMVESKPLYARNYPAAIKRLSDSKTQNRNYLAHEFFNRDWHPMSFLDMGGWLDEAKLSYACAASLLEQLPSLTTTPEQREFLETIPDQMLRHQVVDFMTNQQFRRDYWVKGVRRLNAAEQMEAFNELSVVLIRHADEASLTMKGPIGEVNLNEEIYKPLLDFLSDNKVRSIGEIVRKLQSDKHTVVNLLQALLILMGDNQIAPAISNPPAKIRKQCERLNRFIRNRSRDVDEINFQASPVTGGGIAASRIVQLFMLALEGKAATDEELAQFAWQRLSARNQRLVQDGKALETDEENLAELKKRAGEFLNKVRPVFSALGIQ